MIEVAVGHLQLLMSLLVTCLVDLGRVKINNWEIVNHVTGHIWSKLGLV